MTNSTHSYSSCGNCTFSPFCTSQLDVKHHRTLKRNEIFFLPKHKFQNLYAIQQGGLKTYQAEMDGRELIKGFYFSGEIFGYEAIHTGHYPFSAVAIAETTVCEIPYHHFLGLLNSKPHLQERILRILSQQLHARYYLTSPTAEQKLAAFLLDLASRLHALTKQPEFILPVSRQDIGNYLGLTAETISRLFTRLQKHRILSVDHKKIHFLQPENLKKIANGISSMNTLMN